MKPADRAALLLVLDKAIEWAADNGYTDPREAAAVYRAVAALEPLTRQGETSYAHRHWNEHIDNDGVWVKYDRGCPYCGVMLGTPASLDGNG